MSSVVRGTWYVVRLEHFSTPTTHHSPPTTVGPEARLP
jgi:hypothetical protein